MILTVQWLIPGRCQHGGLIRFETNPGEIGHHDRQAAQASDRASACCRTVRVAFSCLSGG